MLHHSISFLLLSAFILPLNAQTFPQPELWLRDTAAQTIERHGVYYTIINGQRVAVSKPDTNYNKSCLYSRTIHLPDSIMATDSIYYVTDITDAFTGCKHLRGIILPKGLTFIAPMAFAWCRSLQQIDLPDKIENIYSMTFLYCRSLKQVKLPSFLTKIGDSAFRGCSRLKSIVIPPFVTIIESSAFEGCLHLKRIEIPQSVVAIRDFAFGGCENIKEMYVYASNPPILGGDTTISLPVFDDKVRNIPVHIPKGSKLLYTHAPEWSLFTNYIDDL